MKQQHTFAISSIIRQNRSSKEGLAPVYLRITCDSKRSEISVHISVEPTKWNSAKGRVKGTSEDVRRLNQGIETFEHRAREIYNQHILAGKLITAEAIKNELVAPAASQHLLVAEFEKFVNEREKMVGITYSAGTLKNWKVTLGHLKEYLKSTQGKDDIPFNALDLAFLHTFQVYAATQWHCRKNAILKHIERIRKIVNLAVAYKWVEKDPFSFFEGKHDPTRRTFLTQSELASIREKEISLDRLARVRDIFIFSCYTGLAYVDIERLAPDNIVVGMDNKRWIYTTRKKTGANSNIPLLPIPINIIEKYNQVREMSLWT